MSRYFRVRTYHGTYLAIYQPTGAVCAVAEESLGEMFRPLYLYRGAELAAESGWRKLSPEQQVLSEDAERDAETGILVGEAPDNGFFIRPYAFGQAAIPVPLSEGAVPGSVAFMHPGTRFYTAVNPSQAMDHFSRVLADRERSSIWESFMPEAVSAKTVPVAVRALVATIPALIGPKSSLIDLYSRFSRDDLARRADATPIATIMSAFESLGDNCEFGFAQRGCRAEPLGLLRFGGGLGVDGVIAALRQRFDRLGQADDMLCERHPYYDTEYLVTAKAYSLVYHSWRDVPNMDPAIIIAEESKKLRYLRNKLLEDLEDAAKIFVFKQNGEMEQRQILELLSALRSFGDTTLLSVVMADPDHPAGTVVPIADGLLRGYIDRFAPYTNAWDISVPAWIRICRNAYALWR